MVVEVSVEEPPAGCADACTPDPDEIAAAAALLAVVADVNRLTILGTLTSGTTCVCKLQEKVPLAANLLSYHLKVLREAGLVTASRRGRWIDYTLAEDALERLHAALPALPRCAEAVSA